LKKIRAGHITSVHPPLDGRILHKECVTLTNAGYDVVLIVSCERDELVDGVRLRAVPKPKSRSERMSRTVWQVFRAALNEQLDICHFHDPELIPAGVLLRLCGKNVVYDAHENVPDTILRKDYLPAGVRKPIAWLAGWSEQIGSIFFNGIVAATPAIAQRFPSKKTVTVQNFPVLDDIVSVELQPYTERPPIVTYTGAMTVVRGVTQMVQAMSLIPTALGAKLVLAGSCDLSLEREIRQMEGWHHVEFPGWLSKDEIVRLLSVTRIGLILLHPVCGYVESYPTKMFEYMAAGVPVVASNFPLWREIVEGSRCGILADPLDPKSIAGAIQWLLEHPSEAEEMGRNGREVVRTKYNWAMEAQKLRNFYQTLLRV
jgi:glycosyltransferase involved in cell wall biosynthesis